MSALLLDDFPAIDRGQAPLDDLHLYIEKFLIYNILDKSIVPLNLILDRLMILPVSLHTLIAYRHVLLRIPAEYHYLSSGDHFIAVAPVQYGAIYALSEAPTKIKLRKDSDKTANISKFAYDSLLMMQDNDTFNQRVRIITDREFSTKMSTSEDFATMVRSRSERMIDYNSSNRSIYYAYLLIDMDWLEQLGSCFDHRCVSRILFNCEDKKSLPNYWLKYSPIYEEFLQKAFRNGLMMPRVTTRDLLVRLFPEFFAPATQKFSALAWYIYHLPEFLQGYLLGYPIHISIPTRDDLHKLLLELSLKGPTKYAQDYSERQRAYFEGRTIVNSKDALAEDVFAYSNFDIIEINTNDKNYLFTRPEFDNLISNYKNYWTNTEFSLHATALIITRLSQSQALSLPAPVTLHEFLTNLYNYTITFNKLGIMTLKETIEITDDETESTIDD